MTSFITTCHMFDREPYNKLLAENLKRERLLRMKLQGVLKLQSSHEV